MRQTLQSIETVTCDKKFFYLQIDNNNWHLKRNLIQEPYGEYIDYFTKNDRKTWGCQKKLDRETRSAIIVTAGIRLPRVHYILGFIISHSSKKEC